ncbi:hypothetical protein F4861DRAFT_548832 [Xylaria intraflava]|nr:hypothetical protein F4861DRAFT_548832 [Xylaria intraflava]
MLNAVNHQEAWNSLVYGTHEHSAGFSHQPQRRNSRSRAPTRKPKYSEQYQQYMKDSWNELVERTPQKDASADEVHSWVLEVFRRRCHPAPELALKDFRWKGIDLHSQRRYLALRIRFRREPYGYMIAHDIHDAVKESRKRTRRRESEAKKQARKNKRIGNKHTPEPTMARGEQGFLPLSPLTRPRDITPRSSKGNTARQTEANPAEFKEKKGFLSNLTMRPKASTSSRKEQTPPPEGQELEDPFRDPTPSPSEKSKKEKSNSKPSWLFQKLRKKSGATTAADSDLLQDPFRDPEVEPMRLVAADDFRVGTPQGEDRPLKGSGFAAHGLGGRFMGSGTGWRRGKKGK